MLVEQNRVPTSDSTFQLSIIYFGIFLLYNSFLNILKSYKVFPIGRFKLKLSNHSALKVGPLAIEQ